MSVKNLTDLYENISQLVRRSFIPKLDIRVEHKLLARPEIFKVERGECPVGKKNAGSIGCSKAGRSKADLLDGAEFVSITAEVADSHRLVEDDDEAAEEILERFLSAERNCDAADAEAGQNGFGIEAEIIEECQEGQRNCKNLDQSDAQGNNCDRAGALFRDQTLPGVTACHIDKAQSQPGDGGNRSGNFQCVDQLPQQKWHAQHQQSRVGQHDRNKNQRGARNDLEQLATQLAASALGKRTQRQYDEPQNHPGNAQRKRDRYNHGEPGPQSNAQKFALGKSLG